MTKQELFNNIRELYIKENSPAVIKLWENYPERVRLDLSNQEEIEVCEALSASYFQQNMLHKSYYFTKKRINLIKKSSNITSAERTAFDLSFFLMNGILEKEKNDLKKYKFLIKYKQLGGNNAVLLRELNDVENIKLNQYSSKLLFYLPFLIIIFISLNSLFSFAKGNIFTIFLILSILYVIIFFIKRSFLKNFFILILKKIFYKI